MLLNYALMPNLYEGTLERELPTKMSPSEGTYEQNINRFSCMFYLSLKIRIYSMALTNSSTGFDEVYSNVHQWYQYCSDCMTSSYSLRRPATFGVGDFGPSTIAFN